MFEFFNLLLLGNVASNTSHTAQAALLTEDNKKSIQLTMQIYNERRRKSRGGRLYWNLFMATSTFVTYEMIQSASKTDAPKFGGALVALLIVWAVVNKYIKDRAINLSSRAAMQIMLQRQEEDDIIRRGMLLASKKRLEIA